MEVGKAQFGIPECHIKLLLDRFFKIRMYFECRQINNVLKMKQIEEAKLSKSKKKAGRIYASKSAAGHAQK